MSNILMLVLCTALSLMPIVDVKAQGDIPIGTWRTHLAFNEATKVAIAGSRVYAATRNGIFFFDKSDNSINKITRIDGLTDIDISALGASSTGEYLLIGYSSGNLDILNDSEIINFSTIADSRIPGSKEINHIQVVDGIAYLSTDFGVVVFNIANLEISESYLGLASDGSPLAINASAVYSNQLFLSTDDGIIAGSLIDGSNLQDFNSWKRFSTIDGIAQLPSPGLAPAFGQLFAAINNDGVYRYDGTSWSKLVPFNGEQFTSISSAIDLVIISSNGVFKLNSQDETEQLGGSLLIDPSQAMQDVDGAIWVADMANGLVSNDTGTLQSIFPSGPFADQAFKLRYFENKIFAMAGGYGASGSPQLNDAGYYIFEDGNWTNYNNSGLAGSNPIPNVVDLVDAESSGNLTYLASYGHGLVQWDNQQAFTVFDENNSPFENTNSPNRSVLVSAVAANEKGLWVTNYGSSTPLHLLAPDLSWQSFNLQSFAAPYPLAIAISAFGDKWLTIDPSFGGGIVVYNDDLDEERHLTSQDGDGGLPSNTVNDVAIDLDDQAWVGTSLGIVFFQSASSVLNGSDVDAIFPIFEQNILLRNQNITAIAVDGGNRKWIGTNTGLWLFSEQADRQVFNFNTDNSPILSNNITDLAVHQKTGEVFIATDQGLISFRGTATEGSPTHGKIKIFPNPVTPSFNGLVGITGLATDAVVKITDISGKLIFQTKSEGGTATWDVLNYRGEKAQTGVYLVFSSTQDGEDNLVGKIAIVN